jgi:hypothetical protein
LVIGNEILALPTRTIGRGEIAVASSQTTSSALEPS